MRTEVRRVAGETGSAVSTTVRVRPLDGLRGFALIGMLAWHAQLVARERSAMVVVDFDSWSSELSDAEFRRLVPDGIHSGREGAQRAWAEVLGPALDDLHRRGALTPTTG